jgi:hypothetical protein
MIPNHLRAQNSAIAALLSMACAPHQAPVEVARVQPFERCSAPKDYEVVQVTRAGWSARIRDLRKETEMILAFQDPDSVTPLPTGNYAYTYYFDLERQTSVFTRSTGNFAVSGEGLTRAIDDLRTAYEADGRMSSESSSVIETTETVGCKTTIIFAPNGTQVDAISEGPTCIWPETVRRTREVRVPCPPREPPPELECAERLSLPIFADCPLFDAEGNPTGFFVSEGGRAVQAASNCDAPTTYEPGRNGYLFVRSEKHNVEGYARSGCFGDEEPLNGE